MRLRARQEWRRSITETAGKLLREWDIESLPAQLRRNSLDYYYLSVWPGLADLSPASQVSLPARPARTEYAYIHIPFCSGLCDFCSYFLAVSRDIGSDSRVPAYVDDLIAAASFHQTQTELDLSYVYLGGGTPSLLYPKQMAHLLDGLSRLGVLPQRLMGTMEVHPEAFTDSARMNALLDVAGAHGIKRVSLGFQSHDADILGSTNRRHGAAFLDAAMEHLRARDLMINIDLMYGLPGQSLESWVGSLELALDAHPDSISTYFTFIDHGTKLRHRVQRSPAMLASHAEIQTQHLAAQLALGQAGYHELPSDFYSKPSGNPAHYTQQTLPSDANMIALGAGAYGYYPGVQFFNYFDFKRYHEMASSGRNPIWRAAVLTPEEEMCRDIMFSFKNAPALDIPLFAARHGVSPLDSHPDTFARLSDLGLTYVNGHEIRLTGKGRLVVEEIACAFAPPRRHRHAAESRRDARLLKKHNFVPTYPAPAPAQAPATASEPGRGLRGR